MLSHRSASRLSSAIVLRPTTSRILTLSPSSTSTSTSTSTPTSASTSALFSRYLTTLLPHAHRPLLLSTSSSQRRHLSVWNILERGKNAGLRNVEKQANQHPSEAHLQALLYRAWNGANQHHHVVTRYESGRVAHDDTCYREYVKAMSALGRLQHLKVPTTTSTSQQQPYIQPSSQPVYYPPPQTYQPDLSQHLYGQPTYQQQSYPSQTYGQPSYASAYQHPHQHTQHTQYASSTPTSSGGLTPEAPLYVCQVPETGGSVAKSVVSKLIGGFLSTALIVAFFIALGPIIKSTMTGSSPKEIKPDTDIQHTFADVKGCDEAKHELEEIVQFLKNPQLFTRLGGKLPKGVLLMGPPGTGKTLLAKAIAGEAGVPFFYCAGSEFEEMYVGVGAARIRTLFAAAKKKAPCIVFIDEIDAVGGQRGQRDMSAMRMTLNQLLTEMDGFQENSGVIVIGATNLTQLLDKALVRPGRFDKHVVVPLPDVKGRKQILDLYASKVKIAPDVDTSVIARSTPGCTGADLFNLINSAALRAAASSKNVITMKDLEYAKDKILMGAERVSQVMTLEARKLTAYHEGGHAIMALHTKGAHPLYKATIMPRGQALGMVHQLPETDVYTMSKQQMLAQMDVCMGGRVAEEMIFGPEQVTSGASSDLEKATSIAKSMVTKYGMSDKVGPISYSDKELSTLSATMKKTIDDEINTLLESSRQRAVTLLQTHHGELESLAQALLKYETLDRAEIERILKGLPLQEADQVLTQPVVSHVPSSTPGPVKPLLPIPNNACDGITENQTAAEQQ